MGESKKQSREEVIKMILLFDPEIELEELNALSTEVLIKLWKQMEIIMAKLN